MEVPPPVLALHSLFRVANILLDLSFHFPFKLKYKLFCHLLLIFKDVKKEEENNKIFLLRLNGIGSNQSVFNLSEKGRSYFSF